MKCFINCQLTISLLILLSLATCEQKNYLKIPLTYFPVHVYNDSSASMIMDNIIKQQLYANINIGTPQNEIHLALICDMNEFYIKDGKDIYSYNEFHDFKFYNNTASSTNKKSEDKCDDSNINAYYFNFASCKQDVFYFNNKGTVITFYEAMDNNHEKFPGGLGLSLEPDSDLVKETSSREQSFFEKAKRKNLISSYDWSIFFNSKKYKREDKGFLIMGCSLNETNSDLGYYKIGNFSEEFKKDTNMISDELKISLNKILIYNRSNESDTMEESNTKIELDFNNGGIKAPKQYLKYFEKVFDDYLKKKICFKDHTYIYTGNDFFYCKKEIGDDIKKIKENFPVIIFQSGNLDSNFTLEADDLFIEEGDYIFCLLHFDTLNDWNIGKPLLRKYQFSFNYDKKKIYFYKNPLEKEKIIIKTGIPLYILIISIAGIILVMALIAFLLYKFYFYDKCLRKKRANELTDDGFVYTAKEDEQKNQEDQQNHDENDKLGLDIN